MSHDLSQRFEEFIRGAIPPDAFTHDLLTLCKTQPERAWEALALLDQYFRRGRISAETMQSLRHRIGRQALGIETYRPAKAPAPAAALTAEPTAAPMVAAPSEIDAEDPTIETLPPVVAPDTARAEEPRAKPENTGREWPAAQTAEPAKPIKPIKPTKPAKTGGGGAAVSAGKRWRPYFRTFPVMALAAVVLAVAASPTVREGLGDASSIDAAEAASARLNSAAGTAASDTAAPAPERGPEVLSLSSERYIVEADRTVAEFSVERSPEASGDASFLWWTEPVDAKPDEDFIGGTPRRAQIPDGVSSVKLRVPILANPNRRHVQMFYVVIGRPGNATALGPIHRAAVFILPLREP
jgi:hypothetical protein